MKNKYEIRGGITAIFINHKGEKYETLIDTEDLPKTQTIPNKIIAVTSRDKRTMYAMFKANGKYIRFHRFLTDAPKGMEVDHFNHNGLDNRRSTNLRVITSGENNQNLEVHGRVNNKSSGMRGVTFDSTKGKWIAQVRLNKKYAYSGIFETLEEAEIAAKEARAVLLPYSIEAATIVVKDPSKYIDFREMPTARNKSGVKNVYYCKRTGRWKINIKVNGKKTPRSFSTKEIAVEMLKKFNENTCSIDEITEPRITKSGVKCVTWNTTFEKWQAVLTYKKRKLHLGSFETKAEAEKVVLMAKEKINLGKVDEILLAIDKPRASNKSSGIRNVCWSKSAGKWAVAFYSKGNRIHIGYYNDLNEAARIADENRPKYRKAA